MKSSVSTECCDMDELFNFWADPDYSPPVRMPVLLSPLSYKPCYAELYVGKIRRIRIGRCSDAWFYDGFIHWGSEPSKHLCRSTCDPLSALPVVNLSSLTVTCIRMGLFRRPKHCRWQFYVVDLLVRGRCSRITTGSSCGITLKCQFAQRNALPVIGSAFSAAASSTDTAIGLTFSKVPLHHF